MSPAEGRGALVSGTGAAALAAPALFVLLWATGAPMAKLGLPYADPMSFLAARFALAALLLGAWCAAVGARAPEARLWPALALVGVLTHAVYLGGLFGAIALGLSAGLAALIAGLSPLFVAMIAALCGWERVGAGRAAGMALGFAGAALALWPKLEASSGASAVGPGPGAVAICFGASLALAIGTLVQRRRLAAAPLASGGAAQYAVAAASIGLVVAAMALVGAPLRFEPAPTLLFTLGWQVILLSLGAVSLYYWMLRRGEASSVASLMFLTPGAAAAVSWAMFGETLGPVEVAGFIVAMLGVALASRGRA